MRNSLTLLACGALLLGLGVPAAFAQSTGAQPPPEKKKASKVWTNDDFPERPPQAPAPEKPKEEAKPAPKTSSFPWAELDQLREQRQHLAAELQLAREGLEKLTEERRRSSDPARLEALDEGIKSQEQEVAAAEARLQEIDAQIASLEKQAKGRKRPKPAAQPSGQPPAPPSS